MKFTPEAMRARFHELADERDAILADIAPLRAKRDAIVNEAQALMASARPLEADIREREAPLADIGLEIRALVRALNGQTGERTKTVE